MHRKGDGAWGRYHHITDTIVAGVTYHPANERGPGPQPGGSPQTWAMVNGMLPKGEGPASSSWSTPLPNGMDRAPNRFAATSPNSTGGGGGGSGGSTMGTMQLLAAAVSPNVETVPVAPRADVCYEHLAAGEAKPKGTGPPARWPLGHETEYVCKLSDMALAGRLREAYEVGFKGYKREKPTEVSLVFGEEEIRPKRVYVVEEVSCDTCGVQLGDLTANAGPRWFYYCRQCKRRGNRYELCLSCHALEVLQAEGKHSGTKLHTHFLKCEHRSLVKRRDLRNAYPGSPHLKRAFCDYCGQLAAVGAHDGEVYTCTRCPIENNLRFELCASCAHNLYERGRGIRHLATQ